MGAKYLSNYQFTGSFKKDNITNCYRMEGINSNRMKTILSTFQTNLTNMKPLCLKIGNKIANMPLM